MISKAFRQQRLLYSVLGAALVVFIVFGVVLVSAISSAASLNIQNQTQTAAASNSQTLAGAIEDQAYTAATIAAQQGMPAIIDGTASQSVIDTITQASFNFLHTDPPITALYTYANDGTFTGGQAVNDQGQPRNVDAPPSAWDIPSGRLHTTLMQTMKDGKSAQILSYDPLFEPYGNFNIIQPIRSVDGKSIVGALVEQVSAERIFGPYVHSGDSGNLILSGNVVINAHMATYHSKGQLPVTAIDPNLDDSITGGLKQVLVGFSLSGNNPQFNFDGAGRVGSRSPVSMSNLQLVNYASANTVSGATQRVVITLVIFLLLLIAALAGIFYYLNRQVQRTEQRSAQIIRAKSEALTEDIVNVSQALAVAREGDLTVQVPDSESEVGLLSLSLNGLISDYSQIVGGIIRASHAVQEGAARVDEGVRRIVDVATGQAESVAVVATSVEDVAGSAVEVQQATAMATGLAASARVAVHSGQESVGRIADAVDAIKEAAIGTTREFKRLQEDSIRLTALVASVKNNAENLDMQAANATIEARRLGTESGSAFATNIGRLARQAQETLADAQGAVRSVLTSIDEVNRRIERISEQVRRGVEEVRAVRVTFEDITQTNSRVVQFIDNVADSATTQANSAQQAAHSISEIAQVFEQFTELLITSGDEIANMRLIVAGLRESVADLKVEESPLMADLDAESAA